MTESFPSSLRSIGATILRIDFTRRHCAMDMIAKPRQRRIFDVPKLRTLQVRTIAIFMPQGRHRHRSRPWGEVACNGGTAMGRDRQTELTAATSPRVHTSCMARPATPNFVPRIPDRRRPFPIHMPLQRRQSPRLAGYRSSHCSRCSHSQKRFWND